MPTDSPHPPSGPLPVSQRAELAADVARAAHDLAAMGRIRVPPPVVSLILGYCVSAKDYRPETSVAIGPAAWSVTRLLVGTETKAHTLLDWILGAAPGSSPVIAALLRHPRLQASSPTKEPFLAPLRKLEYEVVGKVWSHLSNLQRAEPKHGHLAPPAPNRLTGAAASSSAQWDSPSFRHKHVPGLGVDSESLAAASQTLAYPDSSSSADGHSDSDSWESESDDNSDGSDAVSPTGSGRNEVVVLSNLETLFFVRSPVPAAASASQNASLGRWGPQGHLRHDSGDGGTSTGAAAGGSSPEAHLRSKDTVRDAEQSENLGHTGLTPRNFFPALAIDYVASGD